MHVIRFSKMVEITKTITQFIVSESLFIAIERGILREDKYLSF